MTDTPIKSAEVHWPEWNATVRYDVHGYHLDFKVREGTKQSDGSTAYTYFNEDGGQEWTDDFDKAERFVDGFIKWDGCSHLNFGDGDGYLHLCGGPAFRDLAAILAELLAIAAREVPHFDSNTARV